MVSWSKLNYPQVLSASSIVPLITALPRPTQKHTVAASKLVALTVCRENQPYKCAAGLLSEVTGGRASLGWARRPRQFRRLHRLGDFVMWDLDVYAARAAECQQKAEGAKSKEEKQSWLTMAESWQRTAELKRVLERQKVLIEKAPTQGALSDEFWPR